MPKYKFGKIPLLEIVGDGAIVSSSIGVGRLVPCLILDTTDRKDVSRILNFNPSKGGMDSEIQWSRPIFHNDEIVLRIKYEAPFEVEFHILFNVLKHGIIVESIMNNKAVILYEGISGENVRDKVHSENDGGIIVEVPDTGYKKTWRNLWSKNLAKKFRAEGYNRKEVKEMTQKFISEIENFKHIRME